ncbi:hypothetical protein J6590_065075 [Homalodisca vitripennis]|nr:hypothetical protein J6590_065075 [Homalodisca vitripennis]
MVATTLIRPHPYISPFIIETLFAGVRIPLLPLTFLFSAFRYYRRPVVPNLSYLSVHSHGPTTSSTLFIFFNSRLNTPTRPSNSYISYVLQRRFTQVGRFFPMPTDPLRPHPYNKEYRGVFRNGSAAISNRLEQADHIALWRDVAVTAAIPPVQY